MYFKLAASARRGAEENAVDRAPPARENRGEPMKIPNDKPRQIVLIMTDTQRTDMVGCYGYP